MEYNFTGKITPSTYANGVSQKSGQPWAKQDFVLTYQDGDRECNLLFTVFGSDKIAQFDLKMGETVTVSLDFDAHEFKGKWYNEIRCWKVTRPTQAAPVQATPQQRPSQPAQPTQSTQPIRQAPAAQSPSQPSAQDDLPF